MAGKGSLAEEIRTGLEKIVVFSVVKPAKKTNPLDELFHGKVVRKHVQEFACVMSIVALLVGGYRAYRYRELILAISLLAVSIVLLAIGYLAPAVLRPVWKGWMTFAEKLGQVVTFIFLSLAWFAGFVPVAIIARLCGAKTMDLSFRAPVESYWEQKDPKTNDFKLLEKES